MNNSFVAGLKDFHKTKNSKAKFIDFLLVYLNLLGYHVSLTNGYTISMNLFPMIIYKDVNYCNVVYIYSSKIDWGLK